MVTDRVRGDDPWFLITGHTLMVGDVGRTELAGAAEDGARLFKQLGQTVICPALVLQVGLPILKMEWLGVYFRCSLSQLD